MANPLAFQKAYLQRWADALNTPCDPQYSPKAQFTKFAVHVLGWVGRDRNWCVAWEECFGEKYAFPRYHTPAPPTLALEGRRSSTTPSAESFEWVRTPGAGSAVVDDEAGWTQVHDEDVENSCERDQNVTETKSSSEPLKATSSPPTEPPTSKSQHGKSYTQILASAISPTRAKNAIKK